MFYVWLGIIILLAIVELLTVELTTIWFVISGVVALLLTFITNNFLLQFVVFVVLGVILLVSLKSYLQTFLEERSKNKLLNMDGKVLEDISKKKAGVVLVGRKKYIAYTVATYNKKIKKGSVVEILEIDGTSLKVAEKKDKSN